MTALSEATVRALVNAGLDPIDVSAVVSRGFAEDLGVSGDITSSATVPSDARITGAYVARADGVAAGLSVLAAVVEIGADGQITLERRAADGDRLRRGAVLATVDGPARKVLEIERTSLNLLGRLCGIATVTAAWVDAVAGTGARIRDTRKTTTGLRDLEKYAVRCGGGVNHRRGLGDGVLIKDNHVVAAGGIPQVLDAVAAAGIGDRSGLPVQLEVDDLDQLTQALAHPMFGDAPDDGSRQILCDNFTLPMLATAVAAIRAASPATVIEASGGLTLGTAADYAVTGVDYLAVGALTHSAPVLDIALDA